jgi:hypothetical protein
MAQDSKVLIAGSRRLSRFDKAILARLDKLMSNDCTVLVGDANGVDKAVQTYLAEHRYPKVRVYCMEGECRNNVGGWENREVASPHPSRKDFEHYSTKDREMVTDADYGLMLWDGKSRGTFENIVDLVNKQKPVVVYVHAKDFKQVFTIKVPAELEQLKSAVSSGVSKTPQHSIWK